MRTFKLPTGALAVEATEHFETGAVRLITRPLSGPPCIFSTDSERLIDELIGFLKEAKKVAWPKPLKPLCPASSELLKYLQRFDAITPLKAREELGIEHLPRRIKDLKEHGHTIKTTYESGYNGKRYARYSLAKSLTIGGIPVRPSTFEMANRI